MTNTTSANTAQLVHAAIDGMLGSLDPHSYFLSHEQGMRQLAYRSGQLAGTRLEGGSRLR